MKRRILYITPGLQRAGAEKYVHDLILALDKSKFEAEVLTTDDVHSNTVFPHYYYFSLKEQGITLHTFLTPKFNEFKRIRKWLPGKPGGIVLRSFNAFAWIWNGVIVKIHYRKLGRLFSQYDFISVIDALTFHIVKKPLRKHRNYDIHLMCHQSQFDNQVYKSFEKHLAYNVVYIDPNQVVEMKAQDLRIGKSCYFPLSININDYNRQYAPPANSFAFRIGVFTRINRAKPLNNIMAAFSLLHTSAKAEIHLHIFGNKQDEEYFIELEQKIASLGLQNNVVFEGHSQNMLESIQNREINLVWGTSQAGFVGYATVEAGAAGVPLVLSSVTEFENVPADDASHIPPYFYSPEKLARYTRQFIEDGNTNMGKVMREHFTSHHNLEKNIKEYEKYVLDMLV